MVKNHVCTISPTPVRVYKPHAKAREVLGFSSEFSSSASSEQLGNHVQLCSATSGRRRCSCYCEVCDGFVTTTVPPVVHCLCFREILTSAAWVIDPHFGSSAPCDGPPAFDRAVPA